jgi:hypothetical protein
MKRMNQAVTLPSHLHLGSDCFRRAPPPPSPFLHLPGNNTATVSECVHIRQQGFDLFMQMKVPFRGPLVFLSFQLEAASLLLSRRYVYID